MRMFESKKLDSQESEDYKDQFEQFLMNVVKMKLEFKSFNIQKDIFCGNSSLEIQSLSLRLMNVETDQEKVQYT